ncbi:MAG: hypothetical protein Q4G00_13290 [Clostridia bacterium]|nr:hypothetical protein [Clostridia bacterium]
MMLIDEKKVGEIRDNLVEKLSSLYLLPYLKNSDKSLYGLCRNLLFSKTMGIIISTLCMVFTAVFSCLKYDSLSAIPAQNYLAFMLDALLLLFWIAFATKKALEHSGIAYAKALIASIDSIS